MKIAGSYTLDAPRQAVWDALNDLDVLARVVPGCQRLEQTGEHEFEGTLKIGIAAVKGTYSGKIRLEDVEAPRSYRLIAAGRSANAVIDGTGAISLDEQDGKTVLTYSGDADIGGTLASVGQRLMEGASRQLLNQSLKALAAQVAERMAPPALAMQNPTVAAISNGHAFASEDVLAAAPAATTSADPVIKPLESPLVQPPEPPAERRAVIVPEHEQLKPESMVQGMIADFVGERPWLPWVIIAFLLGYLLGRARRNSEV